MLHLLRKPSAPGHESLLAARPMRNELVRETPRDNGLRLIAPLKRARLWKAFAGNRAAASEKTFELDELGAWLWHQCNGRRSVETLIHAFAKNFRLNLREAEVSVLAFLKTLTQRNLLAHLAPKNPRPKRRPRKQV